MSVEEVGVRVLTCLKGLVCVTANVMGFSHAANHLPIDFDLD